MTKKIKKIHFVGIKGVGMTPLAIMAKEAGFEVSGCDLNEEFITDVSLVKAGIKPEAGFSEDHVKDVDLVITTGAHGGLDNIENKKAKQLDIPVWLQGEAVGKFLDGEIFHRSFEGISVAGSHGKTTTTAMIATILKENNLNPSYVIGTGSIISLPEPGNLGKGKYFVAEADEYATEPKYNKTPKLLWHKPKIGVITNIEFDHPDVYPSIEELNNAFLGFAKNIKPDGVLVACIDDEQVRNLLGKYQQRTVTYGFSKTADYYIDRVSIESDRMFFWVKAGDTLLGEFLLNVAGEHNALNALSAIVVCLEIGLPIEKIKKGLLAFAGTKRRFEYIGKLKSGALAFDDYAHHPTEIKKTLATFKKSFPTKQIVCIFQPHTFSRTKSLFEQFVSSFGNADEVILLDIFSSQREQPDPTVSSRILSDKIARIHKNVFYIPTLEDVVKYVEQKGYGKDSVLISMGAGDVYKIWKSLL